MSKFIKKINKILENQVKLFENQHGNIEQYFIKQMFESEHKMIVEDIFFHPDLESLEKYEKELNGD